MATAKKKIGREFSDILEIISGETKLREREEQIQKLKREAIKEQKAKRRKKIVQKEVQLEESDIPTEKVVQNIKLFEWEAPERYGISFDSKMFWIILAITLLFVLYLAILEQYYLMAAIISLLFFIYVAGTNKPSIVKHKITKRGVDTAGRVYEWFMLESFWFSIKNGQYILILETKLRYPRALLLLLDEADKDAIFILLQERVLYRDIRKQSKIELLSYGQYIPFEEI
ncbi:hypothetical protein GX888_02480 [Candidatus Dojkabacteria bacterium]|uniref:DUF5673 domain-containing protein n=1 Tax=Candidatus Dojkabacteria bacterium TaxID=2099670 RepID=A0A847VDK4_9BACT|nr:hypothetical protein [Candidatus Dojkabacteria bacterium]